MCSLQKLLLKPTISDSINTQGLQLWGLCFTINIMETIEVFDYDLLDAVCLCHAGLAQDSPEDERFYLNQLLGLLFAYLTAEQRKEVDVYLAEKKYLPPVNLIL